MAGKRCGAEPGTGTGEGEALKARAGARHQRGFSEPAGLNHIHIEVETYSVDRLKPWIGW